ncbi:serine/threonine protein kinase [bacterium]|nr:serine/threonine protein kinase [bacterium]MCI0604745.1 serine/threonine protein kinase [bacterium]
MALKDKLPELPSLKNRGGFFWLIVAVFGMAFLSSNKDVLIAAIVFGSITSWIFLPMWMRHKKQLAQTAAQKSPEEEGKMKKLEERLQNLEALICRLDSEMNYQLERSLSLGRIVTNPDAAGVSQMPTTFMNVATALEGRYQILKELGRGGMGIVFHAYDKELREQVAIKILSPLLSNDQDALQRLKREVSAARRITHSNIIRIHDISEINGLTFISMEYFHGTSLKDYIKRNGALSMMQGFNIAAQVCDGLEAAHREGVIHRDLKSQNIILDQTNRIKIIDFGLARTAHMEGMTATGLIMGTPEYMAPEQVSGKKIDERADIYSLGIILYEIFTGRVPFTGDSAIAVGFMQLKEEPELPTKVNPGISTEIERIICKALEKDPIHRYRTITELKKDLEAAVLQPQDISRTAPQRVQVEQVKS